MPAGFRTEFHIHSPKIYQPGLPADLLEVLNDFSSARLFHESLEEYSPSPLIALPGLAEILGPGNIHVKNEGQRFGIAAVKMLGASYAIHHLLKADSSIDTFCTATDGNHGKSVAWAAKHFNRRATIFVPQHTVPARIAAIRKLGAAVTVVPGDYDAAVEAAKSYSRKSGACLIQDTAWEGYLKVPALITAGYYTQLNETHEQLIKIDTIPDLVILQAGVGTWPSAVVHYLKMHPRYAGVRILCVEPYESDCFMASAKASQRSPTSKSKQTIMAGLNCGSPSHLAWNIMNAGTDIFLTIDDRYAMEAMHRLYYPTGEDPRIEAGESGSAGIAALLAIARDPALSPVRDWLTWKRKPSVLVFNTEHITDPELFHSIVR